MQAVEETVKRKIIELQEQPPTVEIIAGGCYNYIER